ncbi:MAG: stage II sporulation protein E [Bacteroidetes bacterium]|nr:MAG: stage II sporulation protein E [Bacteroidota bacterium]
MDNSFYIEVGVLQKSHTGERICGDIFLSRKIKEENRTIVVLSDGMGHGVKANLLATLTATMAINFTAEHKDVHKIAEIIMNTLPVCSERKISYATFTIVDIEENGQTTIINYDNPESIVLRGEEEFKTQWHTITLETGSNKGKEIQACTFKAQKEDRIVLLTDGVTQSGLGKGKYLLGFGWDNTRELILSQVKANKVISATKLASAIVNKAHSNDEYYSKDDISTAVVYFREPRKLLLCSGPPFDKQKDEYLAEIVKNFNGKKIIAGGTTADIISLKLDIPIEDTLEFDDPDLPPISHMQGIELVTEGILTLSKVSGILENYNERTELGKGPADNIIKLLLESDEIFLCIGTAVNIAHQDPNLPVELEIRRSVAKKIANLLEEKFLKEVNLEFI